MQDILEVNLAARMVAGNLANKLGYLFMYYHAHNFTGDINEIHKEVDTKSLMEKSKDFFKKNGLLLNWKEFEKLDQSQKINTLAMIAPVTNEEKQKLLEAVTAVEKVSTLESIMSFYLYESNFNNQTIQ